MSELFWPTTWWGWGLVALSVVLVILPSKYDPAIRFKEWMEERRRGKS